MWYKLAKSGAESVPTKKEPDVTEDMLEFLLDQGKGLDNFYINSKIQQSDLFKSLTTGEEYPENEPLPIYQTLEDQLEERHSKGVPVNEQSFEKGKGGMRFKNGEGIFQYNSGKGMPSVFYDDLPFNKTLV